MCNATLSKTSVENGHHSTSLLSQVHGDDDDDDNDDLYIMVKCLCVTFFLILHCPLLGFWKTIFEMGKPFFEMGKPFLDGKTIFLDWKTIFEMGKPLFEMGESARVPQ